MIVALVGAVPDEVEAVIGAVMDERAKVQRFSVSHRPLNARSFALRTALERDRFNADWLTIVPVEHPEEVATIRAIGGRVAHVYSMCAHPSILIDPVDLMVAVPGGRRSGHVVQAVELYSQLRSITLASRERPAKKRA